MSRPGEDFNNVSTLWCGEPNHRVDQTPLNLGDLLFGFITLWLFIKQADEAAQWQRIQKRK